MPEKDRRPPGPQKREQAEAGRTPPFKQRGTPSEQPILSDGQLGGTNLEKGPERKNPEGTIGSASPPTSDRQEE